jgi:prophage antirepressor-like protein
VSEIIPFDFEEHAVRVVLRDGEPWFVAADVCRVLEIGNPSDAVSRLDDDERETVGALTLGIAEGQSGRGGARSLTIISESGLYALVLTSRKEAARRFRKWITAEVLPAIRRTGRYDHTPLPAEDAGEVAGLPLREAELWLSIVREARLTRGTRAAAALWARSPLPPLSDAAPRGTAPEGGPCLAHLLAIIGGALAGARAGNPEAAAALTRMLCRALPEGLFVGNGAHAPFTGTRWSGGAHAAALASLPGALAGRRADPQRLGGAMVRGVVVPWSLVDAAGAEAAA